jgi:rRNA-processing protein FCF1
LIELRDAGLLDQLKRLVKKGKIKIPEGVYKELRQKTDKLRKTIELWERDFSFVVNLDLNALTLLRDIEKRYGLQFNIGGKVYAGFWKSASGKRSIDSQVLALAKARGWTVVSNDNSLHGACMLEDVRCQRWEEDIGRLLLGPERQRLPGI